MYPAARDGNFAGDTGAGGAMSLSAVEWGRVEALLPELLTLAPAERAAFLDRHCADSARVRAELESLAAANESGGSFMETPVAVGSRREEAALPRGTRFGAWEIGELLGRGGMGEVYGATRVDGHVRMEAAIKVLKRGLDTDELVRRFNRERNILARLSHPNIARLIDGGVAPDGRPYYVMERVSGTPITRWCRERSPGIQEILRLMTTVCEGVDAAHASLVIHRDLKPSNVLVTDAGEVKLLDFGVAKILAEEDAEHTRTEFGGTPLSPSYAAPEQLQGAPVSTAVDVFALGVMLYQFLTGQLPHRREGLPLVAIVAGIDGETTERASKAVSRDPQRRAQARRLKGDLDLILQKALHKDPQRRYRSAHDLGADLERFLAHRPIEARPDSWRYRSARFLQRNPVASGFALAAVLALLAGTGLALWQAQVAEDEARTARAISAFLTEDLLAAANPAGGSTRDLTVRQLLDRAAASVDAKLAHRPRVAAEIHGTLGQAYARLGELEQAKAHLEKSVASFGVVHGARSVERLTALLRLAQVIYQTGDVAAGCALAEEARAGLALRLGPVDPRLLSARMFAINCLDSGQSGEALAEYRAIAWDLEQHDATASESYVSTLLSIANGHFNRDEYEAAVAAARKAVAASASLLGVEHLETARLRSVLALYLMNTPALDEAERELFRALEDQKKWVGDTEIDVGGHTVLVAVLRGEQGRPAEAERAAREFLDSATGRQVGSGYRPAALTMLAEALLLQDRLDEAIGITGQALDASHRIGMPAHHHEFRLRAFWAEALLRSDRVAEAAQVLAELREDDLAGVPAAHPGLALVLRARGLLWLAQHDKSEALPALEASLAAYRQLYGEEHWRTRRARSELQAARAS
jgi:eukaryotic-like serine/threonine-protein kinase